MKLIHDDWFENVYPKSIKNSLFPGAVVNDFNMLVLLETAIWSEIIIEFYSCNYWNTDRNYFSKSFTDCLWENKMCITEKYWEITYSIALQDSWGNYCISFVVRKTYGHVMSRHCFISFCVTEMNHHDQGNLFKKSKYLIWEFTVPEG